MYQITRMFCWVLIYCAVTTVLGRTLPDSPKDDTIFHDSNRLNFSWFKRHILDAKNDEGSLSGLTCQTEECTKLGHFILSNMNKNVNPCDDFFEYACGNWSDNRQVPSGSLRWDVMKQLEQDIQLQIREIWEAEAKPEDILPLKLSKQWYKACMNEEAINARGLSPIISVVSKIGGWPLSMEKDQWNSTNNHWTKIEKYYANILGLTSLVGFQPAEKEFDKDNLDPTLEIDVPDFPLQIDPKVTDRSKFYSSDSYKKVIMAIANKIANETGTILNQEKLAKDVDDLINFEKNLYEIGQNNDTDGMNFTNEAFSEADHFDPQKSFNYHSVVDENVMEMKKDELSNPLRQNESEPEKRFNETKNIFKEYLEDLIRELNSNREDVHIVLKMESPYLQKYFHLLFQTPFEVLVNYIHWSFISKMIKYTTNDMKNIISRFQYGYDDTSEEGQRWKTCIEEIKMSDIISYEYVKKYFPEENLKAASDMIDVLKNGTKLEIERSAWMNDNMKKDAKEKVDKMKQIIGYPKWYNNNTAVENHYNGLNISFQHFENALNYEKYEVLQILKMLSGEDIEDLAWSQQSPPTVNAQFLQQFNSLIVSAGLFNFPLFSILHPDAFNFGLLGSIVSHEISHGFDPTGRNYDKDGKMFTWDEQMDKEYMSRAECFINQYKLYTVQNGKYISHVNSNITLDENIADCTGIHSLYNAFKLWRTMKGTPDPKIPGFEDFSEDQLFFISTASLWCETIKPPERLKVDLDSDEHSPGRIRVLGELSNSEEFSKAFSCPVGSYMNPEKKCNIWK
ncbi:neprilysin-like [Prorops nasuta]|uniref:neprilysin-like n=1 Tax=Prorops nasuta TaxID=863751 RepID=UPI0034CD7738